MRKIALTISALALALTATAQNQTMEQFRKEALQEFRSFRKQAKQEYSDFRAKANAEYAEFLKEAWREYQLKPKIDPPKIDPPVQPVAPPRQSDKPISPKPLVFGGLKPIPKPVVPKMPRINVPTVPPDEEPLILKMPVDFYGATCNIRLRPGTGEVQITDISESAISAAWTKLADGRYELMLADCVAARDRLHLCDWGYYLLTKRVAEEFCEARNNNSKMLQAYLMTQAGYKIRIARASGRIFLMFPSQSTIYNAPLFKMDGVNYYLLDDDFGGSSINVSNAAFPGEQGFSINITEQPQFPYQAATSRTHKASKHPELQVTFASNKNLIDFYNAFPTTSWDIFSYTSLSQQAKDALYPTLRKAIEGKDEAAAANILINFVQTGFQYKTDGEQFGRERSLFGDETLHYPYSDCEDRAILYSILVRELLGLDVALVHYPGHLATAVCFKGGPYGDYFTVANRKFTVCDPTYIGANIGMTMPDMNNNEAELMILR
ncbi:MAG: hypothetical protein IJX65_05595 [Alistipes sp.]|nr:hypothetical protein [Alistipes sp.]